MKLLQFRMDAGDEALKKHFTQMAGNAKYTSRTIQNEILAIASTMGVEEIIAEANESFISVFADESCDISGKEQLSIVLRYTKGDKVNESLQDLLKCLQFPRNLFLQLFGLTSLELALIFESLLDKATMVHQLWQVM